MRPIDHFFSQIDSAARVFQGKNITFLDREGQQTRDRLINAFSGLAAPVLGKNAASDLCLYCLDRVEGEKPETLQKLGYMAAFLTGEYDDNTMKLDEDDWNEIRETLEDVSGEIDLNTLTELLADLLDRGILDSK